MSVEEFAHGHHYGDYSGVVFSAAAEHGSGPEPLLVSQLCLRPLFVAIMDRVEREDTEVPAPRLVAEWNLLTGWAAGGAGPVSITPSTAIELVSALERVTAADLRASCTVPDVGECLRCSHAIRKFLLGGLERGEPLFIEDH